MLRARVSRVVFVLVDVRAVGADAQPAVVPLACSPQDVAARLPAAYGNVRAVVGRDFSLGKPATSLTTSMEDSSR